jgi:hypothetical protein
VKYLWAQRIFIVVLLLSPATAIGSEFYTYCEIVPIFDDTELFAYLNVYPDYDVMSSYSIYMNIAIENMSGQALTSTGPVAWEQNGGWQVFTEDLPAQPDVSYLAHGTTYLLSYYYYWQYDIYPYNAYANFWDAWGYFYLNNPNYPCDGFISNTCSGSGFPYWVMYEALLMISNTYDSVHTPPCAYPTALTFYNYSVLGRYTYLNYYWTSSTGMAQDLNRCQAQEEINFAGAPSYPPPNPPWQGWETNKPNPYYSSFGNITETMTDIYFPGALVSPYQLSQVVGGQKYQFRCPCYNNKAWTNIEGPNNFYMKVLPNGQGGWKYEFYKYSGSPLNTVTLP